MIDVWTVNLQVIIAVGVTLAVILLMYLAFFKDSADKQTPGKQRRW